MTDVTRRELLRYGVIVLAALVMPPRAEALTHAERFTVRKPRPFRPHRPVKGIHLNIAAQVASEPR